MVSDSGKPNFHLPNDADCVCFSCQIRRDFLLWLRGCGRRLVIEAFIDYCHGLLSPDAVTDKEEDETRLALREVFDNIDLELED